MFLSLRLKVRMPFSLCMRGVVPACGWDVSREAGGDFCQPQGTQGSAGGPQEAKAGPALRKQLWCVAKSLPFNYVFANTGPKRSSDLRSRGRYPPCWLRDIFCETKGLLWT